MNKYNLRIILEHFLPDEVVDCNERLEEEKEVFEVLPSNTDQAIGFLENINYTDHIVYNLLLLDQDLNKEV